MKRMKHVEITDAKNTLKVIITVNGYRYKPYMCMQPILCEHLSNIWKYY